MRTPDPSVFVVGATGYVGAAVVEEAARREHVRLVTAHVRPGSERAAEASERFARAGDLVAIDRSPLDADGLDAALAGSEPTHVFLCHGTTAKRGKAEGLDSPYEAIDVGITELVVSALLRRAPSPDLGARVVYLSSVGTSPRARSPYLAARWRAEEVVRGSGLPYTICRAPLLTGPDRRESRPAETWGKRLADPLLGALGLIGFGRLRDRYRSMDAREAAEGLVRSGFHYMTINRVVESDELRKVGVYERERWTPASRRDTDRH